MQDNISTNTNDNIDHPVSLDFTELNSVQSWQSPGNYYGRNGTTNDTTITVRKYTREQIRRFLEVPQSFERQLKEVSHFLFLSSAHYKRLMYYFSNILTYDNIIVPIDIDDLKTPGFKKAYNRVKNMIEDYNIKHNFSVIMTTLMLEGVFYGIEVKASNSIIIQKLPSYYCKITGIEDGTYVYSFNFQYFTSHNKLQLLDQYPESFKEKYNDYLRTQQPWQEIDGESSLCFKFDESIDYIIPPFVTLFEELMDIEDAKNLKKQQDKVQNFKLLHQKIPFKKDPKNEKDMLIGIPSVKVFHNNIKQALPDGIAIVSTPMEIEEINFERKRLSMTDDSSDTEQKYYSSAGVSSSLFNSEDKNTVSLNRSIVADEAIMFKMLRQIERFFKKRFFILNPNNFRFKLWFPDITIFNRSELNTLYIANAQFGFPKSLVGATLGINTNDLVAMSKFENEYLELVEDLKPLQSAHVGQNEETGTNAPQKTKPKDAMKPKGGAPTKDANKLSPAGEKTKVTDANKNRK